jgi:hypothetical protein
LEASYFDAHLLPLVYGVKMGLGMLIIVDEDRDAEEGAYLRHVSLIRGYQTNIANRPHFVNPSGSAG